MDFILLAEDSGLIEQIGFFVLPLIGSILLAYALFNLANDLRKPVAKRVSGRLKEQTPSTEFINERAAKESILRRTQSPSGSLFASVLSRNFLASMQLLLDRANLPWIASTFLANLLGAGCLGYMICYFTHQRQWVCVTIAVAGGLLPLLAVFVKQKMRMGRFMNQLPDVFELMSQALRAGHSLANAILLVGQQLSDPVGTEFARVFHEQNLGIKIEDALKDMAKRVGLMDVRFFVTAVLIQRQTGGDLAEVLDNISDVIRDRIKLFGSVKALTAEGRLSGYVLLALPVVVFLVELLINPNYAQVMIDEPIGQYMLIGAGVAQLMGLALIQKIVNIKV